MTMHVSLLPCTSSPTARYGRAESRSFIRKCTVLPPVPTLEFYSASGLELLTLVVVFAKSVNSSTTAVIVFKLSP